MSGNQQSNLPCAFTVGAWDLDVAGGVWSFTSSPLDNLPLGGDFPARVHPGDHAALEAMAATAPRSVQPFGLSLRVRGTDGAWYGVELSGRGADSSDNAAAVLGGTYRVLDQSNGDGEPQRLAQMLDGIFGFVGFLDREGCLLACNEAPLRATGQTLAQALGRPFWENHAWRDLPAVRETVRLAVRSAIDGQARLIDVPMRAADGSLADLALDIAPMRNAEGETTGNVVLLIPEGRRIIEERRAKEALRASEQHLRYLLSSASVVLYSCRRDDFAVTFISENAATLFGYEARQFVDDPGLWMRNIHPDDAAELFAGIENGLRVADHYVCEYRYRVLDGAWRYIHDELHLVRDEQGDPREIIGLCRDVTEQKFAQERLLRVERSLNNAQRIARLGNWDWDIETNGLWWSDEIYRIFGLQPQEFAASYPAFLERVHPRDRALVEQEVGCALRRERPYRCDHRLVRPDGEVRIVHEEGEVTFAADGRPIGMSGTVQDVTEVRLAEQELRKARDQLELRVEERTRDLAFAKERAENYLAIAGTMIVALDRELRVTLVNRKGCEVLGYSEEELLGRSWTETVLPVEVRADVQTIFKRAMAGENVTIEHRQNVVCTKQGDVRLIEWHNTLLSDGNGFITGTLSSGEDVTEQRRAQAELAHARKMESLGNMAGGIAHSLNNLLLPILALSEMALDDLPPDDGLRGSLERIALAARRSRDLAERMLAFSRVDEPKQAFVALAELVQESLQLLCSAVPSCIHLKAEVASGVGAVFADPMQIQAVFMNLVTNAVDAMEGSTGEIRIGLERIALEPGDDLPTGLHPGAYARLTVSDQGHGMDEATTARIFDPFFTTKAVGKGTGLGLSVAHGIVSRHNGLLRVSSRLNQGTTFEILLPAMDG